MNTSSRVGLKQSILSSNETLAQSVALVAPTAAPLLAIPLVYASSGSGSWLACVFSTLIIVLVALNINQFARRSCSPGSLYSYISAHMHPAWGLIAAWALLIAYIGTAAALAAGLANYINVLCKGLFGVQAMPLLLAAAGILLAALLAYRDVVLSTRLMLVLEVLSVALITLVAFGVLAKHRFQPDMAQFTLHGVTAQSLRMGLVLAIFSSVGFESATSLGSEAVDPLRTIPRAVKWSGILAGIFFFFCAYTEVLGFQGETVPLNESAAPFHVLVRNAGFPAILGILIDFGAVISFFSCVLACMTAAARVLFLMGEKGALHALLGRAHPAHQTPHWGVFLSALATFVPVLLLQWRGSSMLDIYGLSGTLATCGFLTAYILVCAAAPILLRAEGRLRIKDATISLLAILAMGVALWGSIYPIPAAPYSFLPYIYLALLLGGFCWSMVLNAGTPVFSIAHSDAEHLSQGQLSGD